MNRSLFRRSEPFFEWRRSINRDIAYNTLNSRNSKKHLFIRFPTSYNVQVFMNTNVLYVFTGKSNLLLT